MLQGDLYDGVPKTSSFLHPSDLTFPSCLEVRNGCRVGCICSRGGCGPRCLCTQKIAKLWFSFFFILFYFFRNNL